MNLTYTCATNSNDLQLLARGCAFFSDVQWQLRTCKTAWEKPERSSGSDFLARHVTTGITKKTVLVESQSWLYWNAVSTVSDSEGIKKSIKGERSNSGECLFIGQNATATAHFL